MQIILRKIVIFLHFGIKIVVNLRGHETPKPRGHEIT